MSNFSPLEAVGHGSETQLQMGENYIALYLEYLETTLFYEIVLKYHNLRGGSQLAVNGNIESYRG